MWKTGYEAIEAIENRKHHHSGLDLLSKAMEELGQPQDQVQSIHVAGTNGKGSTVEYLRSMLCTAGYKVGTFTSPYLISHHDRIRINNVPISDEQLLGYINHLEAIWRKYELSMFEIDMMIASCYFVDEQVDYAIFEVGMGGRLDATNILKQPLISVITNIGMDHMQYLGDTREKIAYEKAGIIKENVDCVTASEHLECLNVFKQQAQLHHASLICLAPIEDVQVTDKLQFDYRHVTYQLNTKALYQRLNGALAIETMLQLRNKRNVVITDEQMKQGMLNANWLGRFEVMRQDPMVIIDGAHNLDGIQALVSSMKSYQHVHILFSCLKDKQGKEMLRELFTISKDITLCEFDYYRADTANHLSEGFQVNIEKDYQKAIDDALKKEGVLLICGSLYFISVVREYLMKKLENNSTVS